MAVGAAASAGEGSPSSNTVVAAIAIHNVIEGMLVSVPLRLAGMRASSAFWLGQAAGAIEVVAGMLAALWLGQHSPAIPFALAAAGGAMIFLSFEELLPEALRRHQGNAGPVGAVVGVGSILVIGSLL